MMTTNIVHAKIGLHDLGGNLIVMFLIKKIIKIVCTATQFDQDLVIIYQHGYKIIIIIINV